MYSLIYISFYGIGFKGLTPTNFETMKIQMNKNANASEKIYFISDIEKSEKVSREVVGSIPSSAVLFKLMKLIFNADHNILFPCHSIKNV